MKVEKPLPPQTQQGLKLAIRTDSGLDPEGKLSSILRDVMGVLAGKAGVLALWDEGLTQFIIVASHGPDVQDIEHLYSVFEGILPALAPGEQASLEPAAGRLRIMTIASDTTSPTALLPLQDTGKLVGLILVLEPKQQGFLSGDGLFLLSAFIRQVAVSVQNIRLIPQLENLRASLLAKVSHELQTPISIIKAYASTLARADTSWSQQTIREKLRIIEEESDRLNELVSKLLYSSRLEAGNLALNKLLLHLPNEASRLAKKFAALSEKHKIKVNFAHNFPPLYADPGKIREVLTNLLDNAIKFSPEGGTITITGKMLKDSITVTVSDEGIGIPTSDHERVFERFYRSPNSSARGIQGTGLGLYICRAIIHAHGGQILVENKEGKGTSISFTLPWREMERKTAKEDSDGST